MNYIITTLSILLLSVHFSLAQNPRDFVSIFFQKFDISEYKGGEFQFTVDVKADTLSQKSSAFIFLRIDAEDNNILLYEGNKEPIKKNDWNSYNIEGTIDKKGENILIGGQCLFQGKYYYKNFTLRVKKKNGEWEKIPFDIKDFKLNQENHTSQKFTNPINCKISFQQENEENSYLLVDASQIIIHGDNEGVGNYTTVNGVNLYYETYGEGEPLLLIHGNSQSIKDYALQIPVFAKKYKVIAIDTRGHGRSTEDGTPLSYELFAEDMIAFIDYLKLDKVNILGWSDGGNTGLIMAMKAPSKINKLAVMGACLYNNDTSVKPEINKALNKRIKQLEKQSDELTFQKRLFYLLRDEPNINPENLINITCPTLVMAGENDLFFEDHTKLIAEKINDSQLMIFEDGNHEEPYRNHERFNKTVLDFFSEAPYNSKL